MSVPGSDRSNARRTVRLTLTAPVFDGTGSARGGRRVGGGADPERLRGGAGVLARVGAAFRFTNALIISSSASCSGVLAAPTRQPHLPRDRPRIRASSAAVSASAGFERGNGAGPVRGGRRDAEQVGGGGPERLRRRAGVRARISGRGGRGAVAHNYEHRVAVRRPRRPEPATAPASRSAWPPAPKHRQQRRRLRGGPIRARDGC